MAARVIVYQSPSHTRSESVCVAMEKGIAKVGDNVTRTMVTNYRDPVADVAVFYGLAGRLKEVFDVYRQHPTKRAVYIDLGYWGRKAGGRFIGYHKIVVDGRHPTPYFQQRRHDASRFRRFGVPVRAWKRDGKFILLAGMGPKGAHAEGYGPGAWEAEAVASIRRVTDRPIVYRPKPNWIGAPQLPGTTYTKPGSASLAQQLGTAWCVVSHHSNANVEALVAGIPSFTADGVATIMGKSDLDDIESPIYPDGREQWAFDIAYTQWSVEEMAEGAPWRHMKREGLIP